MRARQVFGRLTALVLGLAVGQAALAQELETETARVLESGQLGVGVGYEHQLSSEGSEAAVPLIAEVGILGRFEFIVEPVVHTAIRPNGSPHATGVGDLELTLIGLARKETRLMPAIALAAEVKIPTTHNTLIGTGETDFTGYLILSKQFGRVDTSLNFGYAVLGEPAGTSIKNIFVFAASARFRVSDRLDLFGEVLGNTSSSAAAEGAGGGVGGQAELAGGEVVGTLGASYRVFDPLRLSFSVSYDNSSSTLLRVGATYRFRGF